MAQHVLTGNGSPIDNEVPGQPGAHYIDLNTGKHYLYGTDAWTEGGGGGSIAPASHDVSDGQTVYLEFTVSHLALYGNVASGNINLSLVNVDAIAAPAPGTLQVISPLAGTITLVGGRGQAKVVLGAGLSISGNVISQATGDGMVLTFTQLGVLTGASQNGAAYLLVRAEAITATTPSNV